MGNTLTENSTTEFQKTTYHSERVRINLTISKEAHELLIQMAGPRSIGKWLDAKAREEAQSRGIGRPQMPLERIAQALRAVSRQLDTRLGIQA